jgi:hypothetical protein
MAGWHMPCSPAGVIRVKEPGGWMLVGHRDHARFAGELARQWGNAEFAPPEPFADILVAVARHDDAWAERDAAPCLTREGRPSAFSHELVGTYSAFEEIDLADYLAVRGQATEAVAADNPYAAIIVSMHTVNLLTEQADLRGLSDQDRASTAILSPASAGGSANWRRDWQTTTATQRPCSRTACNRLSNSCRPVTASRSSPACACPGPCPSAINIRAGTAP